MEIKRSVIFNKVLISNGLTNEKLCDVLSKKRYEDKTGIGVLSVLKDGDIVHIEILIRTPTYISNYDQRARSFTKNIVNVFDEVSIDIDTKRCVLYSTSSSTKLNKAKNFLRNEFAGKLSFDNVSLSNEKIECWLDEAGYSHCIISMTIRKFKYNEGAEGRFSANISSQEIGEKLLKEYKDEVRNVVLSVDPEFFSPFIMQHAQQNSISLKCEEADFWTIIDFIKTKL